MRTTKKLLKEVCGDCSEDYCFLQELILHDCKFSQRLIIQMKLIEIYKYIKSEEEGRDIGWQNTMLRWAGDGMAKRFSEVYKDELSYKQIVALMKLN